MKTYFLWLSHWDFQVFPEKLCIKKIGKDG